MRRPEYSGDGTCQGAGHSAPEGASSANIQLFLANAADGSVWWDEISFEDAPAPSPRALKVASVIGRSFDSLALRAVHPEAPDLEELESQLATATQTLARAAREIEE